MKNEEFATAAPLGKTPAPTPDPEQPADVLPEEWAEHQAVMKAIHDFQLTHAEDEPFLDPEELQDPRVREWREQMRQTYNDKKPKGTGSDTPANGATGK